MFYKLLKFFNLLNKPLNQWNNNKMWGERESTPVLCNTHMQQLVYCCHKNIFHLSKKIFKTGVHVRQSLKDFLTFYWLMFEREVAFCAVILKRMFQINEILLYQWSSLNLPKRESGTGIFPLNFAKFLRTPFFTEHLQCMLLVCLELNLRQYWGLKKPTVKYFLMEIMWQFHIQPVFLF